MMYYLSVNTAKFFNGSIISGAVFDLALLLCGLPTVPRALDSWCEPPRRLQRLSLSVQSQGRKKIERLVFCGLVLVSVKTGSIHDRAH